MNETIGIIPRAFRRRGVWVACTLLLRAGLNFLGLAMLLPVLALVLDPGSLEGGGVLTRAYEGLGFASQRTFALAVCAAVVGVIVLKCLLGLWLARVERTYIYDLYRTLSRRLLVTYHDRGLPFVKASNSAVLARNVNVVCLAFAAGVLKPASGELGAQDELRRHRRRGDAARAAVRGADVVHAPRGTARPGGLPALDLALLRTGAQPHQPLRGTGKQGAARKGAARGRDLPRLCRHRDQQCLPDDAPPVRPGDGSGDPHAPARNGDRAAAPDLHRGRAGRGHGPARGTEPRRRRRAGANAVRRIRRGRTAPDALGAQHHDRLDGHQIQPLHDRHPARRRSGLPPGAGKPGLPGHPRPAQHIRRNRCPRQFRQFRQFRQSREPRRRYRQLPRKAAVPA